MIDFKLDEYGDIQFSEQERIAPLKIKFGAAKYPQLKVNFKCRTKKRRRGQNSLRLYFYTDFNKNISTQKIATVTDSEEKNQSIAIRLKTELNELQNFFTDFGSELNRIRHEDLLNTGNHDIVREYVENAIRDIISSDAVDILVERIIDDNDNEINTMGVETLKIAISDTTGKINYTYRF